MLRAAATACAGRIAEFGCGEGSTLLLHELGWPYRSGPPTLIGSNKRHVDEVQVDYVGMLPLWWRIGRHSRRLVPQPARRAVAQLIRWG